MVLQKDEERSSTASGRTCEGLVAFGLAHIHIQEVPRVPARPAGHRGFKRVDQLLEDGWSGTASPTVVAHAVAAARMRKGVVTNSNCSRGATRYSVPAGDVVGRKMVGRCTTISRAEAEEEG